MKHAERIILAIAIIASVCFSYQVHHLGDNFVNMNPQEYSVMCGKRAWYNLFQLLSFTIALILTIKLLLNHETDRSNQNR